MKDPMHLKKEDWIFVYSNIKEEKPVLLDIEDMLYDLKDAGKKFGIKVDQPRFAIIQRKGL